MLPMTRIDALGMPGRRSAGMAMHKLRTVRGSRQCNDDPLLHRDVPGAQVGKPPSTPSKPGHLNAPSP